MTTLPFQPDEPVHRAVIRDMVRGVLDPNPLLAGSNQNTPEAYAARRLRHLGTLLPPDAWPAEKPCSQRTPSKARPPRRARSRRSFLFGRP